MTLGNDAELYIPALFSINTFFRYGETSMHIVKECFNRFSVAFYVPQNSKYKAVFDRKNVRIFEAGLTSHYIEYEMDKVAKKSKNIKSKGCSEFQLSLSDHVNLKNILCIVAGLRQAHALDSQTHKGLYHSF